MQPDVLSRLLQDVYTTRSSRRSVKTATMTAADIRQVRSVSHELNMFSSCDRPCNCRTDYTNWSQSHWPAKWCDTWNVEQSLKLGLIEIVKKLPYSLANGPQRSEGRHGVTPDVAMLRLHISCTMRANGSFAIRGNAEFFSCGMRKSHNGEFAERFTLDFPQITHWQLSAVRNPHSANDNYSVRSAIWSYDMWNW